MILKMLHEILSWLNHVSFPVCFRCEMIAQSYLVDTTKDEGFEDIPVETVN